MNNFKYTGFCFTLEKNDEHTLNLDIFKKGEANLFENLNLFSCLLHSFKPDENSIWRKQKRLDVEIKGWPSSIEWERLSDTSFNGIIQVTSDFNFEKFAETLNTAIKNITVPVETKIEKYYQFEIGNKSHWNEYFFKSRGREICGLCILYDTEFHTRDELEVSIEKRYQPHNISKLAIGNNDTTISRLYGDPSKIIDYFRNQGWTREGDNPTLITKREKRQEKYKLTSVQQDITLQVSRSTIKSSWKRQLFSLHNNTCRICHTKYEDIKFLAPDHRIPAIVQAENLTDENYKEKLMTLCIYCNQRKREFTKKVTLDYDWENSPWAYPEKFEEKKIVDDIKRYAIFYQKSIPQVLKEIERLLKETD
jgi:hypothetical protein